MSIGQIFEGWKNHLSPSKYMKEAIDRVSKERLSICRDCPLNSINRKNYHPLRVDEHCTSCGCTLISKTKCLTCECPEGLWGPELSQEQQKTINDET
jgi:hypothetical protein